MSLSGPLAPLYNPYQQQTNAPQLLPIPFFQGTNSGPTIQLGSLPVSTRFTYSGSKHAGSGVSAANNSLTHHLFHDRSEWTPDDTGDAMLTFVKINRAMEHHKEPGSSILAVDHQFLSISAINKKFSFDPEWKHFNHQQFPSISEWTDFWNWFGVQQNDTPAFIERAALKSDQRKQNFHFARRCRFPNIFAAMKSSRTGNTECTEEMDDVFLMMRKFERPMDGEKLPFARPVNPDVPLPEPKTEFIWQMAPYVSHDRKPPPFCLYSNIDARNPEREWVGCYWRVGKVTGVFGTTTNPDVVQKARNAIFPQGPGSDYKASIYSLPQIEVFLRLP